MEEIVVTVSPGHTLWEALRKKDIVLERPCGGRGTCGKCSVELADGHQVLACQYTTPGRVALASGALAELIQQNKRFCVVADADAGNGVIVDQPVAAVDIGTTTVALTLFVGARHATRTFVNPQRAYGADVMSRIRAAETGNADTLRSLIMKAIVRTMQEAAEELGIPELRKARLVVSANTTMQHLLEGLSCEGMGKAPFQPVTLTMREFAADEWMQGLVIEQLPGISAFVGADIVSGLSVISILKQERPVLYVDLGTNGELALGDCSRLLVTSTAAGPAFEGSTLALKLHGAGMLHLLCMMLKEGIMDEYGTLRESYLAQGYRVESCGMWLTQEEIRELQMAKAAIRAGIETLLDVYGIQVGALGRVYLAGGFGQYLNAEDAVSCGMLPSGLQCTIEAVGNLSYRGAIEYIRSPKVQRERMEEISRRAELISLPDTEGFEERYISAMNFTKVRG